MSPFTEKITAPPDRMPLSREEYDRLPQEMKSLCKRSFDGYYLTVSSVGAPSPEDEPILPKQVPLPELIGKVKPKIKNKTSRDIAESIKSIMSRDTKRMVDLTDKALNGMEPGVAYGIDWKAMEDKCEEFTAPPTIAPSQWGQVSAETMRRYLDSMIGPALTARPRPERRAWRQGWDEHFTDAALPSPHPVPTGGDAVAHSLRTNFELTRARQQMGRVERTGHAVPWIPGIESVEPPPPPADNG